MLQYLCKLIKKEKQTMLTGTQIEELVPVVAEYLQIQKDMQYLNIKQKYNKESS